MKHPKGYAFERHAHKNLWFEESDYKPVSEVIHANALAHGFYDFGWIDRGAEVDALNDLIVGLREAARALVQVIERFRPLDAAFGSPSPFALIEESQDALRDALDALGADEVPS